MGAFIEADIGKLEEFVSGSEDIVKRFSDLKEEFKIINSDLLSKWKGAGADAYKYETDHILENVQNVEDELKEMCEGVISDIIKAYNDLDEELNSINLDPSSASE